MKLTSVNPSPISWEIGNALAELRRIHPSHTDAIACQSAKGEIGDGSQVLIYGIEKYGTPESFLLELKTAISRVVRFDGGRVVRKLRLPPVGAFTRKLDATPILSN